MDKFQPRLLVLSADSRTNTLITKKTRVSKACLICRKKKRKCNGLNPCEFCKKYSFNCAYSDRKFSEISNDEIKALKIVNSERNISKPRRQTNRVNNNKDNVKDADSDFDYKKIVEMLIPHNFLQKIKRENVSITDRNLYLTNLIRQNINEEKTLLNLKIFNETVGGSLPPRDIALKLIIKSWDYAGVLFRFYHRPTMIKMLDSLYESNGIPKNNEEMQALSLIYAVLAVGALFSKDHFDGNDTVNRSFYNDEGIKFFNKARDMINFKEVCDIYSIQALFMLTMFLQCSANLKSCYYYIGIAKRLALRERLHRRSSLVGPTMIEDESKKRLFWSIYKVDIYLNCILGLPCSIPENNVDQEFPLDIDDEKITSVSSLDGFMKILNDPNHIISSCGMNNEHTKLILIMLGIHEKLYALNLQILDVTQLHIQEIEDQLSHWYNCLPLPLTLGYRYNTISEREHYLKPSKLLRLDFLLTKLILYKPFFHFISIDMTFLNNINLKMSSRVRNRDISFQITMAHRCIEVSKEIVELAKSMIDEDILNGSYWFSIHTIFHSVACLTIYRHFLKSKNDTSIGIIEDIEKYYQLGYEVLVKLKNNSLASERIYNVLSEIFEEFDQNMINLSKQTLITLLTGDNEEEEIEEQGEEIDNHNNRIDDRRNSEITNNIIGDTVEGPTFDNILMTDFSNHNHNLIPTTTAVDDSVINNLENPQLYNFLFDPQISLEKLLEDLGS